MGGTSSTRWPRGSAILSHDVLRQHLPSILPMELVHLIHSYTIRSYRHMLCIGGSINRQALPSAAAAATATTATATAGASEDADYRWDIWSCHIDIADNELQAARYHSSESLNRGSLILQMKWFPGIYPSSSLSPSMATCATDIKYNSDDVTLAKQCLPRRRDWPTAAVVDDGNVMLVVGGCVGNISKSHVDAFSLVTGEWLPSNTISSMNIGRYDVASSVLDDGRLLVTGGIVTHNGKKHSTYSVEAYNPLTNSWTRLCGMINARAGHASCVYNGRVYVFGGTGSSGASIDDCEVYDPVTDKWTAIANCRLERSHASLIIWRDCIYIIGGENIRTYSSPSDSTKIECYNPRDNVWSMSLLELPSFKHTHVHAMLCNTTLVVYNSKGNQVWSIELTKALSVANNLNNEWYSWPAINHDRSTACSLTI